MTTLALPAETLALSPTARLAHLTARAERGQPIDHDELVALASGDDRLARGAARQLLAHLLLHRARCDAADLLASACEDLGYRHDQVVREALEQAMALDDPLRVWNLWLAAATAASSRHDTVRALSALLNAAAYDFRHGAQHISNPAPIRRMVGLYERSAATALVQVGVSKTPRGQRRSSTTGKLRLAHITAQLVDGEHAPSRVMRTALRHADRERFDTCVVVTDTLVEYAQPGYQLHVSPPTAARAPRMLAWLRDELGIPVLLPRTRQSCVAAAADLHQQMADLAIDVAWFHGSLATPVDWLLCAWQAAPWQVDYGMGVPLHCPAVDYQFFEYAESMEKLAFLCRERGIPYGTSPFGGSDMSHLDQQLPLTRADLHVPDDHVVLGTIGNHLHTRMTTAFCTTVASVLRNEPRVTYLVVGPGDFEAQKHLFGPDLCGGPTPRVRFVGPTHTPGRWTNAFDVYVNEYPAGGGLAVCEAMAARKAVVAMTIDDSTLAAVSHKYLGDEHVVHPATDAAYAERLRALIHDPAGRARMGAALRSRYESQFDGRKWVADVTERIYSLVTGP